MNPRECDFLTSLSRLQAVCGEVEQSERVKEKIQEDVNKLKQQIALRKSKTAEEERSKYLFGIQQSGIFILK